MRLRSSRVQLNKKPVLGENFAQKLCCDFSLCAKFTQAKITSNSLVEGVLTPWGGGARSSKPFDGLICCDTVAVSVFYEGSSRREISRNELFNLTWRANPC